MKVISVWQPYASLTVYGFKTIETRGFAAPKSLIGKRIGIASTKQIKPEQRAAFRDPAFARYYFETNLPRDIEDLDHGAILGTAVLHSVEPITDDFVDGITEEEAIYGWYQPGRYAWRLRNVERFERPIFARGAQGFWDWDEHNILTPTIPIAPIDGIFFKAPPEMEAGYGEEGYQSH